MVAFAAAATDAEAACPLEEERTFLELLHKDALVRRATLLEERVAKEVVSAKENPKVEAEDIASLVEEQEQATQVLRTCARDRLEARTMFCKVKYSYLLKV